MHNPQRRVRKAGHTGFSTSFQAPHASRLAVRTLRDAGLDPEEEAHASGIRSTFRSPADCWHPEGVSDELAIRLRGAVKRYGPITAVDGLDLDVPVGTCVGLLGPNGAGKSTTMRLLTAQAIADEGEIEVLGFRLPRNSKAARAECGLRVPREPEAEHLDLAF